MTSRPPASPAGLRRATMMWPSNAVEQLRTRCGWRTLCPQLGGGIGSSMGMNRTDPWTTTSPLTSDDGPSSTIHKTYYHYY